MAAALTLARRGLGQVAPNPAVGCILVAGDRVAGDRVAGGQVVARGWTQAGGRPHAETEALRRAGALARGATAYVTLEPCAHHGKTGPCAEALIAAGIARAVVATVDPDPRVSGRGLALLEAAGVAVTLGVLEAEAQALNGGFFERLGGRPLVTLKLATSLDGRIATQHGDSQWITGPAARARGHLLRAEHDAIMVGVGTAIADDPALTCRLPGMATRSPLRVVADGRLRLPLTHQMVRSAGAVPTLVVTAEGNDPARCAAFAAAGVEIVAVPADPRGSPAPRQTLAALAARGITRLLVEGGGQLAASLLDARLVDRLVWFRGPLVIGGEGRPAVAALGLDRLIEARRFHLEGVARIGDDLVESYRATA